MFSLFLLIDSNVNSLDVWKELFLCKIAKVGGKAIQWYWWYILAAIKGCFYFWLPLKIPGKISNFATLVPASFPFYVPWDKKVFFL